MHTVSIAPRAGLYALALLAGTALTLPAQAQQQATSPPQASAGAGSSLQTDAPNFSGLVKRVAPAVVRVSVVGHAPAQQAEIPPELRGSPLEEFFRRFGGQGQGNAPPRRTMGQGSGFIIDASGLVVTNHHVIGQADRVTVELADGRELEASVVGSDPQTDIALLKVGSDASLPTVSWGDSSRLDVGQSVLAMGNPFGLGGTATSGIVSARGRQIGAGPYDDFIQTDASINPGNSGGPLFNVEGQVVGVNTAIFSPTGGNIGIGFAVPSSLAMRVIEDLRDDGKVERGWLGVSLQPVDQELAQALGAQDAEGALIAGIEPGSPAEQGGLQPGDLVLQAAGQDVENPRDLAVAVGNAKPGASLALTILRDGDRRQQQVTLGAAPDRRAEAAARGQDQQQGAGALGLALGPVPGGEGATVARVAPGSVAEERGLRPGDIILRAGGKDVSGPGDVVTAVDAARSAGRPAVALQIKRGEGRSFVALPLKPDQG